MHENEQPGNLDKQAAERAQAGAVNRVEPGAADAHHSLNQPAHTPAADEWPDPFDRRPDPRALERPGGESFVSAPGALSTSEPHPRQDPEAIPAEEPRRENTDR